jgi:hypothetical protein
VQAYRADYTLPVLTSRRGIVLGLLGFSGIFALTAFATGNAHLGNVAVVGLAASALVAFTPFIKLGNPIARLIILSPIYLPLFLAAALETSLTLALLLGALGLEVLVFGFLYMQKGTAEVTTRGLQRHRLLTTNASYEEMSGVSKFESRLGRVLQLVGFGATSVEISLYTGKRIRLNIAAQDVDDFIERVQSEIDPSADYDMFFLSVEEAAPAEPAPASVKAATLRGRRPKQSANQEAEAPQIQSAAR